jgi:phosphoglycolate phosphatase
LKIVIMDLDGTLVDSFEDIAAAANYALEQLDRKRRSTAEIRRHVGHGLVNLLRGLMPDSGPEGIEQAVAYVKEYYGEHPADYAVLYPGVCEALDALGEAGIIRGVLSNKMDFLVQKIADRLDLRPRVEEVWGLREGYPLKPNPQSLLDILESRGISPEECLVVGDASPDLDLARSAGARFCGVTWGTTTRENWSLQADDFLIDRMEEVVPIALNGTV